jgi:hypothetical protein
LILGKVAAIRWAISVINRTENLRVAFHFHGLGSSMMKNSAMGGRIRVDFGPMRVSAFTLGGVGDEPRQPIIHGQPSRNLNTISGPHDYAGQSALR